MRSAVRAAILGLSFSVSQSCNLLFSYTFNRINGMYCASLASHMATLARACSINLQYIAYALCSSYNHHILAKVQLCLEFSITTGHVSGPAYFPIDVVAFIAPTLVYTIEILLHGRVDNLGSSTIPNARYKEPRTSSYSQRSEGARRPNCPTHDPVETSLKRPLKH